MTKTWDAKTLDKRFRIILVLFTGAFAALRAWLPQVPVWIDAGFVVGMAGMVGYFTNFLAIRMLFQPKQGKVLGWEGLVPKNKAQIAESLAESVQTQLLAPDIVLQYIHEYRLIEQGTEQVSLWLDQRLHEPQVRRFITGRLVAFLKNNSAGLLEALLDNSETLLADMARDPDQVDRYWKSVREIIADYLNDSRNREILARRLQKLLLEELPAIAEKVDEALEDYLRSRNTTGSIGMSVKKVFAVDSGTIEKALKSLISDEETRDRIIGVMDRLADQAIVRLGAEETQQMVLQHLETWIHATAEFSRQSILPRGIDHLQEYLEDPANWKVMEQQLLGVLASLKATLLEFVDSDAGKALLKSGIKRAVHRINVTQLVEQQVMGLDTDELEAMILNNTGGNLVVIQTLGGALGLVAGLVQVHMGFALPLLAFIVLVYLSFMWNQRRYSKRARTAATAK